MCNGRSYYLNEDKFTCSDSPGSTHAVAPPRARLETTPRQFDHLCGSGHLDDVTFAADPPPAASADDALRRSLSRDAVPTLVSQRLPTIAIASPEGWYSDYGGSPPPTTSNPNQELHTRQHQMHILHKPSVRAGDADFNSTSRTD